MQILIKFHVDDIIHTKIMAILSTGTSGTFNIFYRNLQKKGTVVILKRIDKSPQIFPEYIIFYGLLTEVIKISNFSILPIVSTVFYCLSIVHLLFHL